MIAYYHCSIIFAFPNFTS